MVMKHRLALWIFKNEVLMRIFGPKRDENGLRVFENRILRRIFERDANGEWRRLHNEELHSLCRSPNIVRVIKSRRLMWAGHGARMEEGRSSLRILTGKRPLGKPQHRWENNIRIDFKEQHFRCEELCSLLEIPLECDVQLPGSISHGVKDIDNVYFL
jgi:hypothetical protein